MSKAKEVPPRENGVFEYIVDVSSDGIEAYLTIRRRSRDRMNDDADEPRRPSPDELVTVLGEHKITYGLEMDVIRALSRGQLEGRQRIAQGTPAKPGKDGWVEFLPVSRKPRVDFGDPGRVDYFERDEVMRVKAGTVIAHIHPSIEGSPGRSVTGEVIPAPSSQSARFTILEGAALQADKRSIIATRDGRPIYSDGTIRVVDLLEIEGNVNLKSGNVRYKGGVIVAGDVEENLLVEAKGAVIVRGDVAKARVHSQASIRVEGQVVGSDLVVNAMTDLVEDRANLAKALYDRFFSLCTLAEELLRRLPGQGKEISIGQCVLFVARKKIPDLFSRVQDLERLLKDDILGVGAEQNDALHIVDQLTKPQLEHLQSMAELEDRISRLDELAKRLRRVADDSGHFVGRYAQVSKIVASGSAFFQGRGAYHTQVEAGRFVVVNGVFRGGTASATKGAYIREVGSPAGAETVIRLKNGGFLRSSIIHPGVRVYIGTQVWKPSSQWQNTEVRVSKSGAMEAAPIRSWTPPTPPRTW